MTRTNDAAKSLCPKTCLDCCCESHHWGTLYGSELGEAMGCKHCPATLDLSERCVGCGGKLVNHEFDDDWSGPDCDAFGYDGQPQRHCPGPHPWDHTSLN